MVRRGIYDNDFFSGAQISVYIGDVWVDEVTSLAFAVEQQRIPVYGYASQLFDAVAEGSVLVQGEFSINFKEAGYLWLVLNRYKKMMEAQKPPIVAGSGKPGDETYEGKGGFNIREWARRDNIERIVSLGDNRAKTLQDYAALAERYQSSHLSGFPTAERGLGPKTVENLFEGFENLLWRTDGSPEGSIGGHNAGRDARRADTNALNPFDIYIQYGDYVGDDRLHHTLQKLEGVHIVGTSKQMVISGEPVQETYQFLARNLL